MGILRSLYSQAVTANVPSDVLAPKPPVLGNITMQQDTNVGGIPEGRSKVTLNWTIPTENRLIGGELIGAATGGADVFEAEYDPIVAGYEVYEMSALVGDTGDGNTVLAVAADRDDIEITVAVVANFAVADWIQIKEGGNEEYAKISAINGSVLTLEAYLRFTYTTSATVKEVKTATLKTVTTHYTIVLATGQITLVTGQFTASNAVVLKYNTTLQDLAGFEIYRIPGNKTLGDNPTRAEVVGAGGVVTVNTSVTAVATSDIDTLTAAENGEDWTYYIFAKDDESSANYSIGDAVFVETITTIPQSLSKTVGENKVVLSWDAVTDDNVDGYNVYRSTGGSFVDANALVVNSAVIAAGSPSFDDSADNVSNRRISGEVAFPQNGLSYSYKIESEDTTTAWTTGTRNQDSEGGAAVVTAQKSA